MRVVAVHDTAGNIDLLVASPEDAPPARPSLEPGQYIHEVEVQGLALDMDDAQLRSRLNEVIENFRVEVDTEVADVPKTQLVRKSSAQAY